MGWNIKVDDRGMKKAFRKLQERSIPFATSTALNLLATDVRADLVTDMKKVFDKPTPFTLNAFWINKASPRRLTARVEIRDFAPKGTPAWKYLQPQMEGGPRRMKRLELRLSAISGGQYIVPGSGARLDMYGNMSRGQIGQILSRLSASTDANQNMTDKTTARLRKKGLIAKGAKSDYFVVRSKTGNRRAIGVYQLVGPGQVVPVLVFLPRAPIYAKRFDPDQVVQDSLDKHGASALDRALKEQLRRDFVYRREHR
jgi:hypothetical protein